MCPLCQAPRSSIVKHGQFRRRDGRVVHRFACRACHRTFSDQTATLTYRERKPHLDQRLFRLLTSGVSQRQCARLLGIHHVTVARKLRRLGRAAARDHAIAMGRLRPPCVVVFDEMETFEHTKMKPLSIVVSVEEKSRRILAVEVASMPAKGHLAERSRRKYGRRRDDRPQALRAALGRVKALSAPDVTVKSDESPRYPSLVASLWPTARHLTFKGMRGCVVGQGELKRGGHDPLYALNHTCAMIRDRLKRLSRRTWCTTKDPARLTDLLTMYAVDHNARLAGIKQPRVSAQRRLTAATAE